MKISDEYEARKLRNIFIKGFPEDWNENHLIEIFSKYGTITSCKLMKNAPYEYKDYTERFDERGEMMEMGFIQNFERNKMRAFICYETEEEAKNAINGEKRKEYNGHKLYVTDIKIMNILDTKYLREDWKYKRKKIKKI